MTQKAPSDIKLIAIYVLAALLLVAIVYIIRLYKNARKNRITAKDTVGSLVRSNDKALNIASNLMKERDKLRGTLTGNKEFKSEPAQQKPGN